MHGRRRKGRSIVGRQMEWMLNLGSSLLGKVFRVKICLFGFWKYNHGLHGSPQAVVSVQLTNAKNVNTSNPSGKCRSVSRVREKRLKLRF